MAALIFRYPALLAVYLLIACAIPACDFDNPYVPDSAGSSTLTGRIVTDPKTEMEGAEVFLDGKDSFAGVTDADGIFRFEYVPPGDYSLQVRKKPYLQTTFPLNIRKDTDLDTGNLKADLRGAISGTIPKNKMGVIYGELEIIIYVDGVPHILQEGDESDLTVDLSSSENNVNIHTTTRITVYIDNIPYSAIMEDGGQFTVEFVPPGIYSDIRVKLISDDDRLQIASGSPIVVNAGQTRVLAPVSSTLY